MPVEPLEEFCQNRAPVIDQLYARSRAVRWSVPKADFAAALHRSAAGQFRHEAKPAAEEVEVYLNSLRLDELALAVACLLGSEHAWVHFLSQYRHTLQAAARALVRDAARAKELADSVYGELYGAKERESARGSPLEYYHGRSGLSSWLRAVLARMYVNDWRSAERDRARADGAADVAEADRPAEAPDPDRAWYLAMLREALLAALSALEPRDRLRVSYYYLQQLSLAHIGRLLGEHESTVSRKLARTRKTLKKQVERTLRRDQKLSRDQIRACYEYATGDWPIDLSAALSQPNESEKSKENDLAAFQTSGTSSGR